VVCRKNFKIIIISIIACLFVMSIIFAPGTYAADRYNMSYVYFGSSIDYYQNVENTKNSLHGISPNYFNLQDDGSLELTQALDTYFVKEMHRQGVKVVPFLSNHWDREKGIKALQNRHELTDQIADAVREYDLDGVNVDIENVTETEREMYTEFVKFLRDKLPEGKTLAVAVAPNPYGIKTGWQASFDYNGLARYSDYLMIMAYDESYPGGPAGPVASYNFVENTIKKALTEVPKEKIVLGIPFYGRYWKNGAAKGGNGLSNTTVEELIRNYNGKVTFDAVSKSPKAVITIGSKDVKPTIFSTKLTEGTYTIWYENEASIKYKLELVNKYDLKGTGSWSLGQETQNTWNYYGMWLNGLYYKDVQNHWAKESIISMAEKGWMTGVSESTFASDYPLSRAEAAVILVRAFGLTEIYGKSVSFKDISNHWAKKEILIAAQNDIVLGTGDGKYSPNQLLTRQEMAVMLDRILNSLKDANYAWNPYKDVSKSKNSWSYNSIMKLTHYSIFTGNPNGTFSPREITTRAQMAVLMDRVSAYINGDGSVLAGK
jgi:spore germination protein YaaH